MQKVFNRIYTKMRVPIENGLGSRINQGIKFY